MKKTIILSLFIIAIAVSYNSISVKASDIDYTDIIRLNKENVKLKIGQKTRLRVVNVYYKKMSKKVIWKSSNPKIASISKKGTVSALKSGEAVITAKSVNNNRIKSFCKIKVVNGKNISHSKPSNRNKPERKIEGSLFSNDQLADTTLYNNSLAYKKKSYKRLEKNLAKEARKKTKKNNALYYENYLIKINNATEIDINTVKESAPIKSINHRGYNSVAPENTISAFMLSKKMGFSFIETDIHFTSDDVPVCIHDGNVDRFSNGTGAVKDMTFDTIRTLDFGSWKSDEYTGEKIPSLEEVLKLCKELNLKPYLEMKAAKPYTTLHLQKLVELVDKYEMNNDVTWISFDFDFLMEMSKMNENIRLGIVVGKITDDTILEAKQLKTGKNEVFIDCNFTTLSDKIINNCKDAAIPLEVWSVNNENTIMDLDPYISGITSDIFVAQNIVIHRQ